MGKYHMTVTESQSYDSSHGMVMSQVTVTTCGKEVS